MIRPTITQSLGAVELEIDDGRIEAALGKKHSVLFFAHAEDESESSLFVIMPGSGGSKNGPTAIEVLRISSRFLLDELFDAELQQAAGNMLQRMAPRLPAEGYADA